MVPKDHGPSQIGLPELIEFGDACEQFEKAWQSGDVPDIAGFAAGVPVNRYRECVEELVMIDMEYRWKSASIPGRVNDPANTQLPTELPKSLDQYIALFPPLESQGNISVRLLRQEYRVRHLWGDRPDRDAFRKFAPDAWEGLESALDEVDSQLPARCEISRTSDSELPRRIGRYELLDKLGQGGMGTVFRARHTELGKVFAIKLLTLAHADEPAHVARFQKEIRALGSVDHPNFVVATDAGVEQGVTYLAMELVYGQDLDTLMQRQHEIAERDACAIAVRIANGLQHAHELGYVHRDIKPANVMLTNTGMVKVLDLGISRLCNENRSLTGEGQFVGTLDYCAPEQLEDSRRVDFRTDIFALGATLFALLNGKPLLSAVDTSRAKVAQLLSPEPLSLEGRRELTPGLLRVLRRMMAKRAADRPSTAAEIVEILSAFTHGADLVALARQVDLTRRDEQHLSSVAASTAPQGQASMNDTSIPSRRSTAWPDQTRIRRWLCMAAVVIGTATAAAMLPSLLNSPHPDRRVASSRSAASMEKATNALTACALVQRPLRLKGIESWTITTQFHRGAIRTLAYSPNGKWIASGGADCEVRLLGVGDSHEQRVFCGHSAAIEQLIWNPQGTALLSMSVDGEVIVWNEDGSERERFTLHSDEVPAFTANGSVTRVVVDEASADSVTAVSPSGDTVAAGAAIWSLTGEKLLTLWDDTRPHEVQCWAWGPEVHRIASCDATGRVYLWDPRTGEILCNLEFQSAVRHVCFLSSDLVICAGEDGVLFQYDIQDRRHLANISLSQLTEQGSVTAMSSDGQTLAIGTNSGSLAVVDCGQFSIQRLISPAHASLWAADLSNDGRRFCVSTADWLHRFDRESRAYRSLRVPDGHCLAVSWSPDGEKLALWHEVGRRAVTVWDSDVTERISEGVRSQSELHGRSRMLSWSADSRRLVYEYDQCDASIVDVDTNRVLRLSGHTGGIRSSLWSPDDRSLVTIDGNGAVRVWHDLSAQHHTIIDHDLTDVAVACWSPSGDRVAFGSAERDGRVTVVVWDVVNNRRVCSVDVPLHGPCAMEFSPEGNVVACAGFTSTSLHRLRNSICHRCSRRGASTFLVRQWSPHAPFGNGSNRGNRCRNNPGDSRAARNGVSRAR